MKKFRQRIRKTGITAIAAIVLVVAIALAQSPPPAPTARISPIETAMDMARIHNEGLARFDGAALPSQHENVYFLRASIPFPPPSRRNGFGRRFLDSLTPVRDAGNIEIFPVFVQSSDSTGWTVFRNSAGVVIHSAPPDGPFDPLWIFSRYYTNAIPTHGQLTLTMPSRVVSVFNMIPPLQMQAWREARSVGQRGRSSGGVSQMPPRGGGIPGAPHANIDSIAISNGVVLLSVGFEGVYGDSDSHLEIRHTQNLVAPLWTNAFTVAISNDNGTAEVGLPGYYGFGDTAFFTQKIHPAHTYDAEIPDFWMHIHSVNPTDLDAPIPGMGR